MEDWLLIRKNLLDSDMQKYLQLTSTSVVLGFSYFVGVFIVIITNQVDFSNPNVYRLFIIVTIFVLGYTSFLFIKGYNKIQRISNAIRGILIKAKK